MIRYFNAWFKSWFNPVPLVGQPFHIPALGRIYKLALQQQRGRKTRSVFFNNTYYYYRECLIILVPFGKELEIKRNEPEYDCHTILNKEAIIFNNLFHFYYHTTVPTSKQLPLFDDKLDLSIIKTRNKLREKE